VHKTDSLLFNVAHSCSTTQTNLMYILSGISEKFGLSGGLAPPIIYEFCTCYLPTLSALTTSHSS